MVYVEAVHVTKETLWIKNVKLIYFRSHGNAADSLPEKNTCSQCSTFSSLTCAHTYYVLSWWDQRTKANNPACVCRHTSWRFFSFPRQAGSVCTWMSTMYMYMNEAAAVGLSSCVLGEMISATAETKNLWWGRRCCGRRHSRSYWASLGYPSLCFDLFSCSILVGNRRQGKEMMKFLGWNFSKSAESQTNTAGFWEQRQTCEFYYIWEMAIEAAPNTRK